jgi:hypothetical protein
LYTRLETEAVTAFRAAPALTRSARYVKYEDVREIRCSLTYW